MAQEWWRSAVIYQVYPRSFADANGDGIGDLPGITSRLDAIRELGADAIWLSPFSRSPQRDAGYDVSDYCDVDPLFGTLADFDAMLGRAHELGLKVIADLVPNHSSSDHPWFQAALAAAPGSEERGHYLFRDGRGPGGDEPPNNWESVFGGPAWTRVTEPDGTPGQWYLHLFDSSQPDFDWTDEWVREQFRGILRFWLDRGIDGFRVDVAHGMIKAAGLPDYFPPAEGGSMGGGTATLEPGISDEEPEGAPYWGQPGVHEIFRDWRRVLDEYDDRALCGEAWVDPLTKLAEWVRPDEMQQTFNFAYLETPWDAAALRTVISDSISAFSAVGAPATWVLSNHDVVRHATRLAVDFSNPQGAGLGPRDAERMPPLEAALRRGRAATALMLALPGSSYLYQGEELGLPEDVWLPDAARQDPTWFRTNGERYGRDGCRVPLPWTAAGPSFGFNDTGLSWLPQPTLWLEYARDRQADDPASTLSLYRALLAARAAHGLGLGSLEWLEGYGDAALALRNGPVTIVANLGSTAIALPEGELVVASAPLEADGLLGPDATAWVLAR